ERLRRERYGLAIPTQEAAARLQPKGRKAVDLIMSGRHGRDSGKFRAFHRLPRTLEPREEMIVDVVEFSKRPSRPESTGPGAGRGAAERPWQQRLRKSPRHPS